jgi:uncharacterized protein YeaO (DUF488 family)
MTAESKIRLKRVYDKPVKADGIRLLADRLWPRGIKKTDLDYDDWIKSLCPPNELRKAWHNDELSYAEFKKQYRQSLKSESETLNELAEMAGKKPITLLSAVKELEQSHLPILKQAIEQARK